MSGTSLETGRKVNLGAIGELDETGAAPPLPGWIFSLSARDLARRCFFFLPKKNKHKAAIAAIRMMIPIARPAFAPEDMPLEEEESEEEDDDDESVVEEPATAVFVEETPADWAVEVEMGLRVARFDTTVDLVEAADAAEDEAAVNVAKLMIESLVWLLDLSAPLTVAVFEVAMVRN